MHTDADRPTRRALLRASGLAGLALLAGCTTGTGDPGADDDAATPSPTPGTPSPTPTVTDGGLPGGEGGGAGGTRPAGTGGPAVSLVGVDGPDAPLAADVALVDPVATAETPPTLRVTLTNTGDTAVRVGEGRAARFQYVHDGSGRLVLLPADGEWDAVPDCWRLRDQVAITEEYRTFDLAPGASTAADLALYAAADTDACLPVGEHTFTTRYRAEGTGDAAGEVASGEWGFTVLLE